MSLQFVQFQYGLEFFKLSYSQFVPSFQDVIMRDFRQRQYNSVPLRIEFLNITISNNSEQVGVGLDITIGSSDPELCVDQVGNLSTSKETVLFLGLLFLQTDSPFEMGIMDDLVQSWNNPHIKNFKIRHWYTANRWRISEFIYWINQLHFFDPLHRLRRKLWTSTYLRLEPHLPTNNGCWCKELVKVEIRNLQSLLVCPIILWRVSSTEDDWIFGWRSGLASQIWISFWSSTFLRCRHVNWFFHSFPPRRIQFLRIRSWWRSLWMCKNVSWCTGLYPWYFDGSSVCRCDMKAGFKNPSNGRLSVLKIPGIFHAIYFILQFLWSSR